MTVAWVQRSEEVNTHREAHSKPRMVGGKQRRRACTDLVIVKAKGQVGWRCGGLHSFYNESEKVQMYPQWL